MKMKKMLKRLSSAFLALIMVVMVFPTVVLPAAAETLSGECGDNATWTLNTETGVLTVSGTGKMENYSSGEDAPWYSYANDITAIVIGNGIESIGDNAFETANAVNITIPTSVKTIGDHAFYGCDEIEEVSFGGGKTAWGDISFGYDNDAVLNARIVYAPCDTHNWSGGVVTKKPSHLELGERTYTCRECEATKTESIAKLTAHTFGDWSEYDRIKHVRSCECGEKEYASHTWDDGVRTEPTHMAEGKIVYTCADCGLVETEILEKIAAHNFGIWIKTDSEKHTRTCECGATETAIHTWDEGVVTVNPTHVAVGTKKYTCTGCGAERAEELGKLTGHSFGGWIKANDTQHYRSCVCGESEYETHAWDEGVITQDPTHTVNGKKLYNCTGCGAVKTEVIDKTEAHSFGAWTKNDGNSHIRSCECGATETADHTWDEGTVTLEPTHTATGKKLYTCTVCRQEKTENVDKLEAHVYGEWTKLDDNKHSRSCVCGAVEYGDHSWDEGTVTLEPTHTAVGKKVYTCTVCRGQKSETVDKLEAHVYGEWTKLDDNKHSRTCVCGAVEYGDHSWDEGTVTLEPTHTAVGKKVYTCNVCRGQKSETMDKLEAHVYGDWTKDDNSKHIRTCPCGAVEYGDHAWDDGVVTQDPTHTAVGKRVYTCTVCRGQKNETIDKLTAHVYGDWTKDDNNKHTRTCPCGAVEYGDHAWDDGDVTLEPTHMAVGKRVYTCAVCRGQKSETIDKLAAHVYGAWTKVDGDQHARVCPCGAEEFASHAWDNGVVTVVPTHMSEGNKVYTCTVCSAIKSETIGKLTAHTFGRWNKLDKLNHTRSCECGAIENAPHEWGDGTVITAATNSAMGTKRFTCECGETHEKEYGLCGDSITWEYDADAKEVRLVGVGELPNYPAGRCPWYLYDVESVVAEDGITGIGNYAFARMNKITSITLADSVTRIGKYAFSWCESLENVTLPSGVKVIDMAAFDDCANLKTIVIPASVTEIGAWAFYECVSLETVYFCGSEEEWKAITVGADNEYLLSAEKVFNYDLGTDNAPGDVNGDGEVTNADVLMIFRYIYDASAYPLSVSVADVDGDGSVTNSDVLMIFRNIYDPELYPLN